MSQTTIKHLAIIPDGNRRWARLNGHAAAVWRGHEMGARRLRELLTTAFDMGVTHVTLWGSSRENLQKRPEVERNALYEVYTKALTAVSREAETLQARIHVRGRCEEFLPSSLQQLITQIEAQTASYTQRTVQVLLAYSGTDELCDAVSRLATSSEKHITPEVLRSYLWTGDMPDIDLMIRTGGEPHLSAGFMMWHMANAQLYFTETLFPDFSAEELRRAITDVSQRGRRRGR